VEAQRRGHLEGIGNALLVTLGIGDIERKGIDMGCLCQLDLTRPVGGGVRMAVRDLSWSGDK
jgi:hypothetical protein